ncbi:L,D-transpeptidase family protein [Acuticoccus sediminis]|uniref:L,D-transpeptidase family protein n=1 Tax=Acuticoccus sediminis TaxID=2184697 RepID=UPI00192E350C|nr:L,D-transpeptidase family protein [Acuticoccus sediminis]
MLVNVEGRVMRAAMGRSGIGTLKREGDGATPRGRMTPLAALTRGRVVTGYAALPVPHRGVRPADGWCDDAGSGRYNAYVRRPYAGSHEALLREDGLYDVVVATDDNQRPRVRRLGSAIFVHMARPAMTPTEGCLAFPRAAWQRAIVPLGPYLIGIEPRPRR